MDFDSVNVEHLSKMCNTAKHQQDRAKHNFYCDVRHMANSLKSYQILVGYGDKKVRLMEKKR